MQMLLGHLGVTCILQLLLPGHCLGVPRPLCPCCHRVGFCGDGDREVPTPLRHSRGSQPHGLPWEGVSWGQDPVIRHLHALAQGPVGGVVPLPWEHGSRLVVAQTSPQHWGHRGLATTQGCPFPCRYMVDAADQEKIEASKNELHNLLDKPQLQGIPVSYGLDRGPQPLPSRLVAARVCSEGLGSCRFGEEIPFLGGVPFPVAGAGAVMLSRPGLGQTTGRGALQVSRTPLTCGVCPLTSICTLFTVGHEDLLGEQLLGCDVCGGGLWQQHGVHQAGRGGMLRGHLNPANGGAATHPKRSLPAKFGSHHNTLRLQPF